MDLTKVCEFMKQCPKTGKAEPKTGRIRPFTSFDAVLAAWGERPNGQLGGRRRSGLTPVAYPIEAKDRERDPDERKAAEQGE